VIVFVEEPAPLRAQITGDVVDEQIQSRITVQRLCHDVFVADDELFAVLCSENSKEGEPGETSVSTSRNSRMVGLRAATLRW
jgi:hypothetical protein